MTVEIRPELPHDAGAISQIHERAFGREAEARLVEKLRASQRLTLSRVACVDERPVGHIAYSEVVISLDAGGEKRATGLGPMGVLPEVQSRGVGSQLVRETLAHLSAEGCSAVIVLGHPAYYGRFGFVPASGFGVRWEHPAPDPAFMARELRPGALAPGIVRYAPEFADA